jgi:hypothetical protein
MPLVVPGLMGNSGDKTDEWTNKLVGKKLSEQESNETVRACRPLPLESPDTDSGNSQTFCKRDLPQETRVIEPGQVVTKDFKPDRLNIHLKEDGTVSHVQHG